MPKFILFAIRPDGDILIGPDSKNRFTREVIADYAMELVDHVDWDGLEIYQADVNGRILESYEITELLAAKDLEL